MTYPELLIMRHGQTEWNRAGMMQGRLDSPLTDCGRVQALAYNARMREVELTPEHRAYSSPQGRAMQTATLAFEGLFDDWTVEAALSEIDIGEASGMIAEDVFHAFPQLDQYSGQIGWQFHLPGGETFDQIRARAETWLTSLSGPAVVVSHGVFIRVLMSVIFGVGEDKLDDLPGGQGGIHRICDGTHEFLE